MTHEDVLGEAPFTARVRVALSIARALAAAMGHDDVTEVHVLVGILRKGENPAVAVLLDAGVPLDALRHDLEQLLEPRGRPRPLSRITHSYAVGDHPVLRTGFVRLPGGITS